MNLFVNPKRAPGPPAELAALIGEKQMEEAFREVSTWPDYRPTPLRALSRFARLHGLGEVLYKDESDRFGLGSFKALGGAYAVFRVLQRIAASQTGKADLSYADLRSGALADVVSRVTVCCATDGNHGRAVAWAARQFGCECVIFLHERVSAARADAIARFGARIERVSGNYDDSVMCAARAAQLNGWHLVSDTSHAGDAEAPLNVMTGYTVMVREIVSQLEGRSPPTHVFVQAGVGGLAAAVVVALWRRFGAGLPAIVVVEPERADCLLRSARAGTPVKVEGKLDTVMAGLACGEVSPVAWSILERSASHFMTISDERALSMMRALATAGYGDPPLVCGESAVAGIAALAGATQTPEIAAALGVTSSSRILVFGTEGDTDPELFAAVTGTTAAAIRSLQN